MDGQASLDDLFSEKSAQEKFGTIQGYTLETEIGSGGAATVYLAKGENDALHVIKFINKGGVDSTTIKRFFREVRINLQLEHPNIARTFDFGQTSENIWYLVMEYIDGKDLASVVEKNGAFSAKIALHIALQVASALNYALQKNIIHRDLKPENILQQKGTNTVKLIDFGIGKILGESNLTMQNQVFGTLGYMPPEQLFATKEVDHRADIYSLGATLYYMLCGKNPYWEMGNNKVAIARAISTQDPLPIQEVVESLPDGVAEISAKAMARDIEKRYQTPQEMIRDIQNIYSKI